MKWAIVAAVCAAFIGAGVANEDVHPTKIVKVPVKVHDTKVVERVKVVKVQVAGRQPSGYMTRDNCLTLQIGTTLRNLLWRYGWPADDDQTSSYSNELYYPLEEDHKQTCRVSFNDDEGQGVRSAEIVDY